MMDVVIGAIVYFLVGYAFSYGGSDSGLDSNFLGGDGFAMQGLDDCDFAGFFFQYTFAATAVTIISGAVAERCSVSTYVTYSIVVTGLIYPAVVYWTWSGNAWLTRGSSDPEVGYTDFAGSGVVHMTGGAAALAGCYLMGPRLRRKSMPSGKLLPIAPHSTPLATLGCFILIFGFLYVCVYLCVCIVKCAWCMHFCSPLNKFSSWRPPLDQCSAFNGGSNLAIVDDTGVNGATVALAMVNTILAAAAGGLTACVATKLTSGKLSLMMVINGVLAGMVSICAGCASVRPWASLIIGGVAGLVMIAWSNILVRLGIDDPLDAVPVHLGAGWWGLLAQPMFAYRAGIFYDMQSPDAWDRFGWNVAGSVTIFVWAFGTAFIMFGILKKADALRVSEEVERQGLDLLEHGEKAYIYTSKPQQAQTEGDVEEASGFAETELAQQQAPVRQVASV